MKIIERVEQGEKMADIAHSYNMNYLTRHDSKKQKQDHGTCEVCCAGDLDNNFEEAWKSNGGVNARSASALSSSSA